MENNSPNIASEPETAFAATRHNVEESRTPLPTMPKFVGSSYADVMMMLYSLPITADVKQQVSQRLVQEAKGKNLSRIIDTIARLGELQDSWDGFGASHILPEVISNIRQVLLISKDADWENWTMSPNTNGTIFLQSTKQVCSLSLGSREYSYFSKIDGVRNGKSHLPFDAEKFIEVMRILNQK